MRRGEGVRCGDLEPGTGPPMAGCGDRDTPPGDRDGWGDLGEVKVSGEG